MAINLMNALNNDDTQALEALERAADLVLSSDPGLALDVAETFGMVADEPVTEWEWEDGDDIPFAPAHRGQATAHQLGHTPASERDRDDEVLDWLWGVGGKPAWI